MTMEGEPKSEENNNLEGRGNNQEKPISENVGEFKKMSLEQTKLVNDYVTSLQSRSLLLEIFKEKQETRTTLQTQITSSNTEEFKGKILDADAEVQYLQGQISELDTIVTDTFNQIDDENKEKYDIHKTKSNKEINQDILNENNLLLESKEDHEFSLEEVRNVLKEIEGKEHPNLSILEEKKTIKGNVMYICFTDGEKEMVGDEECEISYLLTIAGPRYKSDGSEGVEVIRTSISKDYNEGMNGSEELADFKNGQWIKY